MSGFDAKLRVLRQDVNKLADGRYDDASFVDTLGDVDTRVNNV